KGPHYVYYTTSAYRMLRDNPDDNSGVVFGGRVHARGVGAAPGLGERPRADLAALGERADVGKGPSA
ncbi:MAG: hypothetical protein R6W89_05400, partial [Candidatus Hydrogenedentota bacterium]